MPKAQPVTVRVRYYHDNKVVSETFPTKTDAMDAVAAVKADKDFPAEYIALSTGKKVIAVWHGEISVNYRRHK